jgi:hypothetical protein
MDLFDLCINEDVVLLKQLLNNLKDNGNHEQLRYILEKKNESKYTVLHESLFRGYEL